MEVQRALEILKSQQQYDVLYEGDSVWIDDVNPDNKTATVHSLRTGDVLRVEVERLHEPQGYQ